MFFIAATNGETRAKSFFSTGGGKTWSESNKLLDMFAYDPNDATGNRIQ